MSKITRLTVTDQVAETLREGLRIGRWGTQLPGTRRLSAELGIARATLMKAIRTLETEGSLAAQQPGDARSVVLTDALMVRKRPLRVAILVASRVDPLVDYSLRLVQTIQGAGHEGFMVSAARSALLNGPKALTKLTKDNPADAWVIIDSNEELSKWFSASGLPVIGIGGRCRAHPMASTGHLVEKALLEVTTRLRSLGHSRIVLLDHEVHRGPIRSSRAKRFLFHLEATGIQTGDYNHPEWKESPEDFRNLLKSLFHVTPPTALICMADLYASAAISFLDRRSLRIPHDVSLICAQPLPCHDWQLLGLDLTRFLVDHEFGNRRVVRWLESVRQGRPEMDSRFSQARVHWGNTIGRPPK